MTRTVLVTGGARRVGAAIAKRLADGGWRIAVHFNRSGAEAEALAHDLGGVAVGADLEDAAAAEALPARAAAALGAPLDAVVNSASIFEYDLAADFTAESFRRHMAVNALAPTLIARAFARAVAPGRSGAVVNLLDQKLWNLNADFFAYTLSKVALDGATKLLARALAPSVRVNAVAPGLVLPSGGQTPEEFARVAGAHNILRRPIDLAAIADAAAFLLDNSGVTGQTILVDNGQHMVASDHDIMFTTRGRG